MYTRETQLRRLQSNDVNRLAETLGFEGGRKLMEIIPKYWTPQDAAHVEATEGRSSNKLNGELKNSAALELKYKPEQIRLIEEATKQASGCYFAEILIQEWSTSGRKHERPTLGLLLHLLIKADLWNSADFVAEHFLNESPPERPLEGPGAKVKISIPTECLGSVEDFVNDTIGYPDTETLNDRANYADSMPDHNRDYYTKLFHFDKELENTAPKPPPRAQRAVRQHNLQNYPQQLQKHEIQTYETHTDNRALSSEGNIGKINQYEIQHDSQQQQLLNRSISNMTAHNIPELSDLLNSDNHSLPNFEEPHVIPLMTLLDANSITASVSNTHLSRRTNEKSVSLLDGNLPLITELNLNTGSGEILNSSSSTLNTNQMSRQSISPPPNALSDDSRCSSLSNDSIDGDDGEDGYNASSIFGIGEDDDGDVDAELAEGNSGDLSLPNLSIFGRQSPNNDSSLTTVTCTSGDNSFELSLNDSSSTSTTDPTALKK